MERLTRLDSTGIVAGVKRGVGDYATDREIIERLYLLENMMDEGRLLESPCKVGTTLYYSHKACDRMCFSLQDGRIESCNECPYYEKYEIYKKSAQMEDMDAVGKTVFLTKEAAEAALSERA